MTRPVLALEAQLPTRGIYGSLARVLLWALWAQGLRALRERTTSFQIDAILNSTLL